MQVLETNVTLYSITTFRRYRVRLLSYLGQTELEMPDFPYSCLWTGLVSRAFQAIYLKKIIKKIRIYIHTYTS